MPLAPQGPGPALAAPAAPAPHPRRPGGLIASIALLLALGLVLAEAAQAWVAWRRTEVPTAGLAAGAWCSVQLVNGQVYYGRFVEATTGDVRLRDVYYVQTTPGAAGTAPNNRLVNRRKTDWHAPESMTVPIDKVLMIEKVGAASRLAQLIAQDEQQGAPGGAASSPAP